MEIVVAGLVALIIGLAVGYFAAQTIIKKITTGIPAKEENMEKYPKSAAG
jgi:uncharacterized protein YneF (UPF0154 family)